LLSIYFKNLEKKTAGGRDNHIQRSMAKRTESKRTESKRHAMFMGLIIEAITEDMEGAQTFPVAKKNPDGTTAYDGLGHVVWDRSKMLTVKHILDAKMEDTKLFLKGTYCGALNQALFDYAVENRDLVLRRINTD